MITRNTVEANTCTAYNATNLAAFFKLCEPGFAHPAFLMRIINTSNVNIHISYDGYYSGDVVLADDELEIPVQVEARIPSKICLFPRGTKIYARYEINPAKAGYLYIISYYQPI